MPVVGKGAEENVILPDPIDMLFFRNDNSEQIRFLRSPVRADIYLTDQSCISFCSISSVASKSSGSGVSSMVSLILR